jgi:hypothetical protein
MATTLLNQVTFQLKSSYPLAWSKVLAAAPELQSAIASTPSADDTVATQLLRALLQAAPSGNYPGAVSPERQRFDATLATAARQLARADGLSEPVSLAGLQSRRKAALASTTLSRGAKAVAQAVTLPAAEPVDSFADALVAVRVFYGI